MKASAFGPKGWTPDQIKSLIGKTYLISGANTGAGFEAARILLNKEAEVVMLNRNEQKSQAAIEKLKDEFSKDIIIAHLSTLLKYANRFYKRQFINRKEHSTDLLERFNLHLESHFSSEAIEKQGIPKIEEIAKKLSVSQRYLSDTLKKETGKSSTEHLQLFLINKAKNRLLAPNATISEVVYDLGFEYPQYFSRLFKKRTGMRPKSYIEAI